MVLLFVAVLQFLRWCHFLAVRFFLFKITTFILFLLLNLSCMNKPQVPGSLKLHQDKVGHGGWSLMAFSHLQSASQLVRGCKLICFVFSHIGCRGHTWVWMLCSHLHKPTKQTGEQEFHLSGVNTIINDITHGGPGKKRGEGLHPCLVAQESWDSYMTCRKADVFLKSILLRIKQYLSV